MLSFITGYYSAKYSLNMDSLFFINISINLNQAGEVIAIKDVLLISLYILIITIA